MPKINKRNFIKIASLIFFAPIFIKNFLSERKKLKNKKIIKRKFSKIWIIGNYDS
jgi:hypothetical protein